MDFHSICLTVYQYCGIGNRNCYWHTLTGRRRLKISHRLPVLALSFPDKPADVQGRSWEFAMEADRPVRQVGKMPSLFKFSRFRAF